MAKRTTRLIDVDVLLKDMKEDPLFPLVERYNMTGKVETQPIVEERRKGKWIGKPIAGYSTVRCSCCEEVFLENEGKWNYCPNCGAKMEEKQ